MADSEKLLYGIATRDMRRSIGRPPEMTTGAPMPRDLRRAGGICVRGNSSGEADGGRQGERRIRAVSDQVDSKR
jgi:hypothetical protein